MKLLTIVGARPQFIKAATVSRVISSQDGISEVLVHTGQHYDQNMSEIFFEELDIPRPDYQLSIGGGLHGQMTGRQLEAIEKVILKEKPDCLVVYGDTNSTLAGALAAAKLHVPVAHVEAGLRSFNSKMPEEINRILTDHISSKLFAPTDIAVKNLVKEGFAEQRIHLVGDVMFDAAIYYRSKAKPPSWFKSLQIGEGDFILATIHRAENADNRTRLSGILNGLAASGKQVVLPLHPRTKLRILEQNIKLPCNIHIVDPVGFLEMVWLELNSTLIATDSGGVQKEAYFHGKYCVTFREETEWVELVESGWNCLVGVDQHHISEAIQKIMVSSFDPYFGDGYSAHKIVAEILQ